MRRLAWLPLLFLGCDGATPGPSGSAKPSAPSKATNSDATVSPPPVATRMTTVNQFLSRGAPTFVAGTLGDDKADRAVRTQIDLVLPLFEGASVVDDTSLATKWPEHPVLYGGPHVNAALAKVADSLPFSLDAGVLKLGDARYEGPGIALIAVVPAREGEGGWPEFLLYAGTGTPGIAEINSLTHGPDPIVIGDVFGPLRTGTWKGAPPVPELGEEARRIAWRSYRKSLPGLPDSKVEFRFPEMVPAKPEDDAQIQAGLRGLEAARTRLALDSVVDLTVYVHPDRRSKISLTGKDSDGHAVPSAQAVHVIAGDASVGGGVESLMAHEGAHVLAYYGVGPPASALMGEGLAVWAAGSYAGKPLAELRTKDVLAQDPKALLGPAFRRAPEHLAYPFAGLLFDAAVSTAGLPAVVEHLLPATPDTWDAAVTAAGTTPAALRAALSTTP